MSSAVKGSIGSWVFLVAVLVFLPFRPAVAQNYVAERLPLSTFEVKDFAPDGQGWPTLLLRSGLRRIIDCKRSGMNRGVDSKFCLVQGKSFGQPQVKHRRQLTDSAAIKSKEGWWAILVDETGRNNASNLGNSVDASALIILKDNRVIARAEAPVYEVFEDRIPRVIDLDGDGTEEIVVVQSKRGQGAALAVYGSVKGLLKRLAMTEFSGQPHIWLSVAGIADFDGDGQMEITLVRDPDREGRLEFWRFQGDRLTLIASEQGFSNHISGSDKLNFAAVTDLNGDGLADLLIPGAGRDVLLSVSLIGHTVRNNAAIAMPGPINDYIIEFPMDGAARAFVTRIEDGSIVVIHKP